MNNYSQNWPKCSASQTKTVVAPTYGYEFGLYCEEQWVNSLNEML
jgi:hypothetical protein